jgi:hypothetical protein
VIRSSRGRRAQSYSLNSKHSFIAYDGLETIFPRTRFPIGYAIRYAGRARGKSTGELSAFWPYSLDSCCPGESRLIRITLNRNNPPKGGGSIRVPKADPVAQSSAEVWNASGAGRTFRFCSLCHGVRSEPRLRALLCEHGDKPADSSDYATSDTIPRAYVCKRLHEVAGDANAFRR